jgi:hypothetical protein
MHQSDRLEFFCGWPDCHFAHSLKTLSSSSPFSFRAAHGHTMKKGPHARKIVASGTSFALF